MNAQRYITGCLLTFLVTLSSLGAQQLASDSLQELKITAADYSEFLNAVALDDPNGLYDEKMEDQATDHRLQAESQATGYSLQDTGRDTSASSQITVSDYCLFLNAVAPFDLLSLYDKKMEALERFGKEGSYSYAVAEENANGPMNYLSWQDAVYYYDWLEHSDSSLCSCNLFSVTCELFSTSTLTNNFNFCEADSQLRSNRNIFSNSLSLDDLTQKSSGQQSGTPWKTFAAIASVAFADEVTGVRRPATAEHSLPSVTSERNLPDARRTTLREVEVRTINGVRARTALPSMREGEASAPPTRQEVATLRQGEEDADQFLKTAAVRYRSFKRTALKAEENAQKFYQQALEARKKQQFSTAVAELFHKSDQEKEAAEKNKQHAKREVEQTIFYHRTRKSKAQQDADRSWATIRNMLKSSGPSSYANGQRLEEDAKRAEREYQKQCWIVAKVEAEQLELGGPNRAFLQKFLEDREAEMEIAEEYYVKACSDAEHRQTGSATAVRKCQTDFERLRYEYKTYQKIFSDKWPQFFNGL